MYLGLGCLGRGPDYQVTVNGDTTSTIAMYSAACIGDNTQCLSVADELLFVTVFQKSFPRDLDKLCFPDRQ